MAINVKKYLKQKLVYWQKTGTGASGQSTYGQPVEVDCRWDDLQEEVQMIDGRKIISNAHVLTQTPLALGSLVMKGTLADWKAMPTYPRIPTKNQGAFEIFKTGGTPDLKGRPLLDEAYL